MENFPPQKPTPKNLAQALLIYLTAVFALVLCVFAFNVRNTSGYRNRLVNMALAENGKKTNLSFKVNDKYMFDVENKNDEDYPDSVSVTKYSKSHYLFAFACGTNIFEGDTISDPYHEGDYFYSEGVKDGEYFLLNVATAEYKANVTLSELTAFGLSVDPSKKVTKSYVLAHPELFPKISMQKESCLDMTLGFTGVYIILIPIYLYGVFKKPKQPEVTG